MDFRELFFLKEELEKKSILTSREEKLLQELLQLESMGLNLNKMNESLGVSRQDRCPKCKRPY